ncbi:hypothetical protein BRX37_05980 [Sphingomonas sp. S-NIH.Pt3_0716]|nr:hypothetical protein BRX37_05980 [Sphingomonas sp. S-NIH.Pt3_0716]
MLNNKASLTVENNDSIEIIKAEHYADKNAIALLIHKGSPNAADPMYRTKKKDGITVRPGKKDILEEQAHSAHVVVSTNAIRPHVYSAVLEEIPGISFSRIKELIALCLREYTYPYEDKKKEQKDTYCCLKALGLKTEALTDALKKKGSINFITLTRTEVSGVPDSEGIAEAREVQVKYRVIGDPSGAAWRDKFTTFVAAARDEKWEDVRLDLNLDDERHKTVKLDRLAEASEILFVRAEQVQFTVPLENCTVSVVPAIVNASLKLMKN